MWQAERTQPELKNFRDQLKELCAAEGMKDDLFEEIAILAMKQGEEPSRDLVLKLEKSLR